MRKKRAKSLRKFTKTIPGFTKSFFRKMKKEWSYKPLKEKEKLIKQYHNIFSVVQENTLVKNT
jgi:hypothetical protein